MSNHDEGIIDDLFFGGDTTSTPQHSQPLNQIPPQHQPQPMSMQQQHPQHTPQQHPQHAPQHTPQHGQHNQHPQMTPHSYNQPSLNQQQMRTNQIRGQQIRQPNQPIRANPGHTMGNRGIQYQTPVHNMASHQMISIRPQPHMSYQNPSMPNQQTYTPNYNMNKYPPHVSPMMNMPQMQQSQAPTPQSQTKPKVPKKALKQDPLVKENEEDISEQFDPIRIANVRPEEQYVFDDNITDSVPLTQQQIEQNNMRDQESFVVNKLNLTRKVRLIARDLNLDVDNKVFDVMQVALQERIKELLERLVDISKLRIDTHKDTLNFCISSNPRKYLSDILKREKEEREKREQEEREQRLENKEEKTNKVVRDMESKQVMGSISNAMGGIIRTKKVLKVEPKMPNIQTRDVTLANAKQEFQSAKERSRKINREDVLYLIQQDPILRCSKNLNEDRIMSLSLFYSSASNIQQ